jgi:tryptophan synthase beta chain
MSQFTKFLLTDADVPASWINVLPALRGPQEPPLHPQTRQPLGPADLQPIFPMSLIEQEFSPQPVIDVPAARLSRWGQIRPSNGAKSDHQTQSAPRSHSQLNIEPAYESHSR